MYAVAASLDTKEPVMLLNQPIGFDKEEPGAPYVDGSSFQNELYELDGKGYDCIKLSINSPGGNVVEGYSICNAILKTKTPVDTYCGGIAASMAASIFMMGRKRIMADYAALMIHNPFGTEDNKMLKTMKEGIIKMLSERSKCTPEEVAKMMDKETWLTADEALEKGFCTSIESTSEANMHRMPRASVRAMWKEANTIQNYNTSNSNHMAENPVQGRAVGTSLIAAYLDLNVDATENAVLTAVKGKINTETIARMKAEEELENTKSELQRFKDSHAKTKKELEDKIVHLEKEIKDAKEAKEAQDAAAAAAVAAAAEATAKAEIDKYVAAGRVKPEQVAELLKMAKATSVDQVKAFLGDLPANRTMPANAHIVVNDADKAVNDPNKTGMSAAHLMAKISAGIKNKHKQQVA